MYMQIIQTVFLSLHQKGKTEVLLKEKHFLRNSVNSNLHVPA